MKWVEYLLIKLPSLLESYLFHYKTQNTRLSVHIIRLLYRQVCFISNSLEGV